MDITGSAHSNNLKPMNSEHPKSHQVGPFENGCNSINPTGFGS